MWKKRGHVYHQLSTPAQYLDLGNGCGRTVRHVMLMYQWKRAVTGWLQEAVSPAFNPKRQCNDYGRDRNVING